MKRLAIMLLVLASASPALAWSPIYPTRPVWRLPVPYSLNRSGSPDLGGFAATEPVVRSAMDDWTNVSCTNLTATYQGMSSAAPGAYDGISVIGWVQTGWPHSSSAIGVTGPIWAGNNIVEADMELNGENYGWTTEGGQWDWVNAYSIVLHEGGHYYGLGHSTVEGSAMWPTYEGGIVGLATDDEQGICALYPANGSTDCTTTGCPAGQECVGGACQMVSGGCTFNSDCASGQICSSGTCVPQPATGNALGEPCAADAECQAGLVCLAGSCTQACPRVNTTSCPSGFYCDADATTSCTDGYCMAGTAGAGALGDPCSGDTECASLYCDGGVCSEPCMPDGSVTCPEGYSCQVRTLACIGSCRVGRSVGDSCEGNGDCTSGMCAVRGDTSFCTDFCDDASPCPTGFNCLAAGDQRVCSTPLGGLGHDCSVASDCLSNLCTSDASALYCTRTCDAAHPCPAGFSCGSSENHQNVCLFTDHQLGQTCAVNADCASGLCVSGGGRATFCTELCEPTTDPCPTGFSCIAAGDTHVCQSIATRDETCGCRAVGARSRTPLALFGLLIVPFLRRRARRPS